MKLMDFYVKNICKQANLVKKMRKALNLHTKCQAKDVQFYNFFIIPVYFRGDRLVGVQIRIYFHNNYSKMPHFRLETNVPVEKIPKDFPAKVCAVLASSLGKPVSVSIMSNSYYVSL